MMKSLIIVFSYFLIFAHAPQAKECHEIILHQQKSFLTSSFKNRSYKIIMQGSKNLSRTILGGRHYLANESLSTKEVENIAERNFKKAVIYLLDNLENIQISKATAIALNKILTKDLVPEFDRGNINYRQFGSFLGEADRHLNSVHKFYSWLESDFGKKLMKNDPVRVAEIIHHNLVALDSFPDGNGRLSRILSDLVLLKAGLYPALYTNREDYFLRGNARSDVSRKQRIEYYYEIVNRSQLEQIGVFQKSSTAK